MPRKPQIRRRGEGESSWVPSDQRIRGGTGRLSAQAHTPAVQRVLALLKAESRQPAPAGLPHLSEGKQATLPASQRQPSQLPGNMHVNDSRVKVTRTWIPVPRCRVWPFGLLDSPAPALGTSPFGSPPPGDLGQTTKQHLHGGPFPNRLVQFWGGEVR